MDVMDEKMMLRIPLDLQYFLVPARIS